jgi:MFS family permease
MTSGTREKEHCAAPTAVLWALQFIGGLAGAPAYALLAVYVEQALRETPLFTASLRSLQLALGGLIAPMAGVLADRLGYKPAYVLGMTSTVAACSVFLTREPLLLVGLFLYSGLLGSLQTTAGQAYLMEAAGRSRLGRASAGYFLGHTLGTALGSAAAGRLASGPGYLLLGAVSSTAAFVLLGAALLLLPSIRESGPLATSSPHHLITSSDLLRRPEVRVLLAIRFLPTCYWGAVTLLVPLLLFRLTGSPAAAGWYAGVSLVLASACQILTGRVCDRSGLQAPLRIAPLGITLSAVGLTLGADSEYALWTFGILGACSAWSLSITMPLLIDAAARPGEKGRMVGLTALAWSAGMLAGNLVAGELASRRWSQTFPGLPFALTILCALGTILLAAALMRSPLTAHPRALPGNDTDSASGTRPLHTASGPRRSPP